MTPVYPMYFIWTDSLGRERLSDFETYCGVFSPRNDAEAELIVSEWNASNISNGISARYRVFQGDSWTPRLAGLDFDVSESSE